MACLVGEILSLKTTRLANSVGLALTTVSTPAPEDADRPVGRD